MMMAPAVVVVGCADYHLPQDRAAWSTAGRQGDGEQMNRQASRHNVRIAHRREYHCCWGPTTRKQSEG